MRSETPRRTGSICDMHSQTFSDLGRAFREAFADQLPFAARESRSEWAPLLDFSETPDSYLVRVDLPGIARDAIDVTTEDESLIIRGENPAPESGDDETLHRRERRYGRFRRALTLPASADLSEVAARLHDGVLEVTVAKTKGAKPRRIQIST